MATLAFYYNTQQYAPRIPTQPYGVRPHSARLTNRVPTLLFGGDEVSDQTLYQANLDDIYKHLSTNPSAANQILSSALSGIQFSLLHNPENWEILAPYRALIPRQQKDSPVIRNNRRERVQVIYQALLELDAKHQPDNARAALEQLQDAFAVVENTALAKTLAAYNSGYRNAELGKPMKAGDTHVWLLAAGRKQWQQLYLPIGSALPDFAPDDLIAVGSNCEYTLINGRGALTVLRVKEALRRKTVHPYNKPPKPDDLEKGEVIFCLPRHDEDALGRAFQGIQVAEPWQMSQMQQACLNTKKSSPLKFGQMLTSRGFSYLG